MPSDFVSSNDLAKALGPPVEPGSIRERIDRSFLVESDDRQRDFEYLLHSATTEDQLDARVRLGAELGLVNLNEPAPEAQVSDKTEAEEIEEPSAAETAYDEAVAEGFSEETAAEMAERVEA